MRERRRLRVGGAGRSQQPAPLGCQGAGAPDANRRRPWAALVFAAIAATTWVGCGLAEADDEERASPEQRRELLEDWNENETEGEIEINRGAPNTWESHETVE